MAKKLKIVNCDQCDNYNKGMYYCVREHKDIRPECIAKCVIPEWCTLDDWCQDDKKDDWYYRG